ncbi:MAG: alanine racemase [Eubacteriales bacterium]|nr:alanine racemase [Eubacteriales bacterium]
MNEAKTIRPAWVEIDLRCVDHNIKEIKKRLGSKTAIMGIIKADAYGHGALAVSEVLRNNGINSFGVATLPEALELRAAYKDAPILVLGIVLPGVEDIAVENGIDTVVCSYEYAKVLSEAAKKTGRPAGVYIAIDTGMGRIGYITYTEALIQEAIREIKEVAKLPFLEIKGVLSHFANADQTDKTYAVLQNDRFAEFCKALEEAAINVPARTFSNSAAIMGLEEAHYDIARCGIVMYGLYPSEEVDKSILNLRPAMTVKARIVHIKAVPPGSSIGYGRKYIAGEERIIATVPVGYADGYPRIFSPKARVIVNGHYALVRGSICMDQFMIDVTDIPDVAVGDEVIIMGSDGNLRVSAEEIARASDTINYEIVTAFAMRLKSVYIK